MNESAVCPIRHSVFQRKFSTEYVNCGTLSFSQYYSLLAWEMLLYVARLHVPCQVPTGGSPILQPKDLASRMIDAGGHSKR